MTVNFHPKVFFYCNPGATYQFLLLNLAEGFRKLGVDFYSNINHWQESPTQGSYLFRHDPSVTPDDCSIVILQHKWELFPDNLFHQNRKYITVYLDGEDRNKTASFNSNWRNFDFIFKTHYNSKLKYPSNVHPWYFGLSERVLREISNPMDFHERKDHLLFNFRHHKAGHSVRRIAFKKLVPSIQNTLSIDQSTDNLHTPPLDAYHYLYWLQTGKRHYPSYYQRLKESVACACFGGFFVPAWPQDPSTLTSRIGKLVLDKLSLSTNRVVQWDSWRFWESMAAGCVSFHVDFEKYGLALPLMPENWRHYVGVDLDNVQETVDRIIDEPDILEKISSEGRAWVLQHYSPTATALRFLETVGGRTFQVEAGMRV